MRGHAVRWRGTMDEALSLPGTYEMMDGWLSSALKKPGFSRAALARS